MTSPTNKQDVTNRISANISEFIKMSAQTPFTEEKLVHELNILLREVSVGGKAIGIDNFESINKIKNIKSSSSFHNVEIKDVLTRLITNQNYSAKLFKDINDTVKREHSFETTAHVKALIFRTLTTICVGLSILFVYWLAFKLDIPMPLMKLPIPS
jgi:hypothetical protein